MNLLENDRRIPCICFAVREYAQPPIRWFAMPPDNVAQEYTCIHHAPQKRETQPRLPPAKRPVQQGLWALITRVLDNESHYALP